MNSVIKGAGYVLVHTPEMVVYNGTTQTTERVVNPESEYLKELRDHLRSYDTCVNYWPNQVYIGNAKPADLAATEFPFYDKKWENASRDGKYGQIMPEDEFYARLGEVRQAAGDRAVLRAIHVYEDNKRVRLQLRALENDNFPAFLEYVKESGDSSWMYLQNVIPEGRTARQEVAFALALAKHLLGGHGACRVHGGGFAGTIQAFVPNEQLEEFRGGIEAVLGEGSCHVLSIRPEGGILAEVCSHD